MDNWKPIATAVEDGTLCQLRFKDMFGSFDLPGPYFLHEGQWYLYDPPTVVVKKPVAWRTA